MRRRDFLLGLLIGPLAGCVTGQPVQTTSLLDRFLPVHGPSGNDVIQMDVALVEEPVGDPYLNAELWNQADDQVVAVERRAVLDDNGVRVGQVGGITPPGLQERLTSEKTCPNPRRIQLHAGQSTTINLGPPLAECQFPINLDGASPSVNLTQAQFQVVVTPHLAADGRTRLAFIPQIQSGKGGSFFHPAPDRSGWLFQDHRPTDPYPDLAWEVHLAANEYVVIGTRHDRPQTFGHTCFIRPEEAPPRQRVLILRTSRSVAGVAAEALAAEEPPSQGPLPLALQAALR